MGHWGRPPSLRALVAEDNAINRMSMERFLEGEGHEVSTAADGTAVLQATAHADFDVILMDIQMPGLDAGMNAAVTKPIQESELGWTLHDIAEPPTA